MRFTNNIILTEAYIIHVINSDSYRYINSEKFYLVTKLIALAKLAKNKQVLIQDQKIYRTAQADVSHRQKESIYVRVGKRV